MQKNSNFFIGLNKWSIEISSCLSFYRFAFCLFSFFLYSQHVARRFELPKSRYAFMVRGLFMPIAIHATVCIERKKNVGECAAKECNRYSCESETATTTLHRRDGTKLLFLPAIHCAWCAFTTESMINSLHFFPSFNLFCIAVVLILPFVEWLKSNGAMCRRQMR